MKLKRLKVVLLILFMCLIIPVNTSAATTCKEIDELVADYNKIKTELDSLDCSETTDAAIVSKCNKYQINKDLALANLFRMNDEADCKNSELRKILSENRDNCGSVYGSTLKDITKYIMSLFYIIAPFLLIIFGSSDFFKIIVSNGSGDSMPTLIQKSKKNFITRVVAFILLYSLPAIVNFILNINFSNYILTGNVYSCKTKFTYQTNVWNSRYIPKVENSKENNSSSLSGGDASDILAAADKVHKAQMSYTYSVGGDLYWNNIKLSTNNPNKVTCCATLVGSTLYVAGIFTEEEMNSYNYNSATATSNFLASKGWIKIDNYSDLQPGDIIFMNGTTYDLGHTQIYAGNGLWYNAGYTGAIQGEAPAPDNCSNGFVHAYRKP